MKAGHIVLLVALFALQGCALLSGRHYVMSYGIETGVNDRSNEFTVSATISGR